MMVNQPQQLAAVSQKRARFSSNDPTIEVKTARTIFIRPVGIRSASTGPTSRPQRAAASVPDATVVGGPLPAQSRWLNQKVVELSS
jgi:hypothetical protein